MKRREEGKKISKNNINNIDKKQNQKFKLTPLNIGMLKLNLCIWIEALLIILNFYDNSQLSFQIIENLNGWSSVYNSLLLWKCVFDNQKINK